MTRPDRRFTILDFLVLTVVMAGASLAARSEAFVTAEQFRQVATTLGGAPGPAAGGFVFVQPNRGFPRGRFVTSPAAPASRWDRLWGEPDNPSQLRSVRLILMSSVKNTVAPDQVRILRAQPGTQGHVLFLLRQCVVLLFPILAGLSFALLLLRVVRPRPEWPELAWQPGAWACLAAMAALFGVFWVEELGHGPISVAAVGAAVALPWLGLALSRRWRAEKSWIDRAGRALGVCWLLAGALAAA